MKSLNQYILEKSESDDNKSCTATFNFADLEEAKDTIESVMKLCNQNSIDAKQDEDKVTITLTDSTADKFHSVLDVLQQYIDVCNNSGKRSSYESYAQRLRKFTEELDKLDNFMDEILSKDKEDE